MSLTNNKPESEQTIRFWKIEDKEPREIQKTMIPLEGNLEDWLEKNISMISEDLLVIGRQILTSYRGFIDLLCIDREGNIVIVELKRDKTPRDITSQVIDYASWIEEIPSDKIREIAEDYFNSKFPDRGFEDIFSEKFAIDFPESINNEHKMIVVGSNIDPSTHRIIRYLNDKGIAINAFIFNYFEDSGHSFIASTYLIEPTQAEAQRTKKKQVTTIWTEALENIANRFSEKVPDSSFSRTAGYFKAIFTDFSRIHFEYGIFGQQHKKSIYTSLHLEKNDREENQRIFDELLPNVKEFEKQIDGQLYYGPWNPSYQDHRWKTISLSREFGENISEKDIEWAVNSLIKLYNYFTPLLTKIMINHESKPI